MKKILVLMALAVMAATPALAATYSIVNSKHDLSSQSGTPGAQGNYNEICVYCHTPHGARIGADPNTLPLWNRSAMAVDFSASKLYNSTTLDNASKPTTVTTYVARSDAPLCYSCHDGSNLSKALLNPPNSAGSTPLTMDKVMPESAKLGDLTNDHPIGMVYETVVTNDTAGFKTAPPRINFYDSGRMWCSSCHDVHNPGTATLDGTVTQFVVTSMDGSLLCLKCHDK